ncbi:MAG: hypothetical protein MZV63_43020 [Marinilabiliales bacterium]|nr:hypothetical protein [Marinilabiliales bacterium]
MNDCTLQPACFIFPAFFSCLEGEPRLILFKDLQVRAMELKDIESLYIKAFEALFRCEGEVFDGIIYVGRGCFMLLAEVWVEIVSRLGGNDYLILLRATGRGPP